LSSLLGVFSSSNWLTLCMLGELFSRSEFMINVQASEYVQELTGASVVEYPSRKLYRTRIDGNPPTVRPCVSPILV
jgi:hypothetical protein